MLVAYQVVSRADVETSINVSASRLRTPAVPWRPLVIVWFVDQRPEC